MASTQQVAELFQGIVSRFDVSKAAGINAAIQFDLQGDGGGMHWLKITDDNIQHGEGAVDSPKMTLKASADDFAGMLTGEVNPMQAFMTGRIKIQGDTGLALKLMPLING
jgi:putative sterol carrier protein